MKSETDSGMMTEERKSSADVIVGRAKRGSWRWWCWKCCWDGGADDGTPRAGGGSFCLGTLRASGFLLSGMGEC